MIKVKDLLESKHLNYKAAIDSYKQIEKNLEDTIFRVYADLPQNSKKEYLRLFTITSKMIASEGITTDQAVRTIINKGQFKGAYITYKDGKQVPFNK